MSTRSIKAAPSEATEALLLSPGGHEPLRLIGVRPNALAFSGPAGLRPAEEVQLGFHHHHQHTGAVRLLARVIDVLHLPQRSVLSVTPIALHSLSGATCLEEFLRVQLDHTPQKSAFETGSRGTFYRFVCTSSDALISPPSTGFDPYSVAESEPTEQEIVATLAPLRQHARRVARVEDSCAYAIGDLGASWVQARCYQITPHGMYLQSDGLLPPAGASLRLTYQLTFNTRAVQLGLRGEAYWTSAPSGSYGGDLAVHLALDDHDEDTRAWVRYVSKRLS